MATRVRAGKHPQRITPCLWFDSDAEAAVNFYTSIFENSQIGKISRYGEAGHEIHGRPAGTVMTIEFELNGQAFTALNGGPMFRFNEAISFQVRCESQSESVMKALLQMKKIDIEGLRQASERG